MSDKSQRPPKAYRNSDFLTSSDARVIRILCEYFEPMKRLKKLGIKDTIVFFGSSHALSGEQLKVLQKQKDIPQSRLDAYSKLSAYREDAVELSHMLTKWSMSLGKNRRFVICSGGGPGMMEAANEGATLAGGETIGFNISLPSEQKPNPHITKELNFEFHYFFMRKFWFAYMAKALIIFPGGFGTIDELFEILTLIQTNKFQKETAILIYGSEYWKQIINFDKLLEWGTIKEEDLSLFRFSDDPLDAFEYITTYLKQHYLKKT